MRRGRDADSEIGARSGVAYETALLGRISPWQTRYLMLEMRSDIHASPRREGTGLPWPTPMTKEREK